MAQRCLLHRSKLTIFIAWLGERSLPLKGRFEVARWKGPANQPMRIIFDNYHSNEHLSCNDAAIPDVLKFIRSSKLIDKNI